MQEEKKVYSIVKSVAILNESILNNSHQLYDQDVKCKVTYILLNIFLEAVAVNIVVNIPVTKKVLIFREQAKSNIYLI